jgi:hypothetical protein
MPADHAITVAHASDLQREAGSILDVIARAAADPTVNVDKLERLLAIQQTILADQRRTAFMAAKARLQAVLPQVTKHGTISDSHGNARNHFAKIEDIDAAIRPLYTAEGFSFDVDSKATQGGATYTCKMSHAEGHSETKELFLPLDTGAGRNNVQSAGSTLSYARRYLIMMHLNLVTRDEDNDGNGAPQPITAAQCAELRSGLAAVGGSEARFLNWLAVASFEEIPAANFARACKFIEEKRRQAKRQPGEEG